MVKQNPRVFWLVGIVCLLFVLGGVIFLRSKKTTGIIIANLSANSATLLRLGDKLNPSELRFGNSQFQKLALSAEHGFIRLTGLIPNTRYDLTVSGLPVHFTTQADTFSFTMPSLVYGKVQASEGTFLADEPVLIKHEANWYISLTNSRGIYWLNTLPQNTGELTVLLAKDPTVNLSVSPNSTGQIPTLTKPPKKTFLGQKVVSQVLAIDLPNITLSPFPTVQVPTIQVPTVQVPTIQVPTVQVPTIQVPTIPVSLPPVSVPSIPPSDPTVVSLPDLGLTITVDNPIEDENISDTIPITNTSLPPVVLADDVTLDSKALFNQLRNKGIKVEKITGITQLGTIKQFAIVEIDGVMEEVGETFSLLAKDIESVILSIKGDVEIDPVVPLVSHTTLQTKLDELKTGSARVIGAYGADLVNAYGSNVPIGTVLDSLMAKEAIAAVLLSYIDSNTGLVTTFAKLQENYTSLIGSNSQADEYVATAQTYLVSLLGVGTERSGQQTSVDWSNYRPFSWEEYGQDQEVYCANHGCCVGKKTESNPSGLYPEDYRSPGPNGGMYECTNGRWVATVKENDKVAYCFADSDCTDTLCCFRPLRRCQTACREEGSSRPTALTPTTGIAQPSNTPKPSIVQTGSPTRKPDSSPTPKTSPQKPTSSTRPSPTQKPTSIPTKPASTPTVKPPTSTPVAQSGSCVQHVTGKGCGKLGPFPGCQDIDETQTTCVSSASQCTPSACEAEAWSKARSEAAAKGATLDEAKTVIKCQTTYTAGGC